MTLEIMQKRRLRRRLEKQAHRTKLSTHWDEYRNILRELSSLIRVTKLKYYSSRIINNKGNTNSKNLAVTVKYLLSSHNTNATPNLPDTANSFADFFCSKISNIYESLKETNATNPAPTIKTSTRVNQF